MKIDSTFSHSQILSHILQYSPLGILVFDANCVIKLWNPVMEKLLGEAAEDCIGSNIFELFPFLEEMGFDQHIYQVLEGKTFTTKDVKMVRQFTNQILYLSLYYFPLYNKDGVVNGGLCLVNNKKPITDAQTAHNHSEHKLQQILDLLPYMIYAKDKEGRFVLANKATADIYGTTVEGLLGIKQSYVVSSSQEVRLFLNEDRKVLESGQTLQSVLPFTDFEGTQHQLHTFKALYQTSSKQGAVLGISIDMQQLQATIPTQKTKAKATQKTDSFMQAAIAEAQKGLAEGGIPIGSVLVKDGKIIGRGHNQRVQKNDPMTHAETDCLRNAGRIGTYKNTTLYSTLMPCYMCAGTVVQFGIKKVIVGENTTFDGAAEFMQRHGVEVINLQNKACIDMMTQFIHDKPELWHEDIGE